MPNPILKEYYRKMRTVQLEHRVRCDISPCVRDYIAQSAYAPTLAMSEIGVFELKRDGFKAAPIDECHMALTITQELDGSFTVQARYTTLNSLSYTRLFDTPDDGIAELERMMKLIHERIDKFDWADYYLRSQAVHSPIGREASGL